MKKGETMPIWNRKNCLVGFEKFSYMEVGSGHNRVKDKYGRCRSKDEEWSKEEE